MPYALQAVADNARRLLEDSELLFEAGRYPTAIALAILAFEEAGKYFFMALDSKFGEDPISPEAQKMQKEVLKGGQRHGWKQLWAGIFRLMHGVSRTVKRLLGAAGLPDDDRSVHEFIMMIATLKEQSDDPEAREWARRAEQTIVQAIEKDLEGTEPWEFVHRVRDGEINRIKQRGLYVDVTDDGDLAGAPSDFGREDAERWVRVAREAMSWLDRLAAGRGVLRTARRARQWEGPG